MKNLPEGSDPKKLRLSSKLGKIGMAILTVQICVHRQRRPLNYVKTTFQALPWLHWGLTMPLDTKLSRQCTVSMPHAQVHQEVAWETQPVQNAAWHTSKWLCPGL